MTITTSVQTEAFDLAVEAAALTAGRGDVGAVVTFTGHVRDRPMTLEHYPGMTERQLAAIAAEAEARWALLGGTVIHRHGHLLPGEAIVLVAALSRHRREALERRFMPLEPVLSLRVRTCRHKRRQRRGRHVHFDAH